MYYIRHKKEVFFKNMDRTKEFFPKEIMIKTEFIEDENGKLKKVTVKDYDTLAKIFLEKLNAGYDMISLEAFELLDVDRDWLLNNFRDEFDYFLLPIGVLPHILETSNGLDKYIAKICKKYGMEEKDAKYGLRKKRMFIHRGSYYKFIFNRLKITESLSRVVIEDEKVNKVDRSTLTKLSKEFLVKNKLATLDKKTKDIKHTEFVRYDDLDQETFDLILNYEYGWLENHGLKSQTSLKRELLRNFRYDNRLLQVSNEQVKRQLDDELELIKFAIVRDDSERHPIRYFMKSPVKEQLNIKHFTFTVSAKYDDKLDIIAKQFTAYVLNYLEEKEKKSKKKKSHR